MFESVSSQTALFFGLLVGVLTTLIAALIWAQSALRRRQADGAASRQAEIDALDLRAEDLAAALGHRESELLRERDRCQRLEAQLHLLVADTPQACAAAILRIVDNPQERQRLATAGRERMLSHHAWARSMVRLDGIIQRGIEIHSKRTGKVA